MGLTRDGGDSIYLVNGSVKLEQSGEMDEFTVSKIDSCYQVDELRDLVLHSIASGDEVILDVAGDQADVALAWSGGVLLTALGRLTTWSSA